jgi:molybdopterin molybdotransferase
MITYAFMLDFFEARRRVLAAASPLEVERIALASALNRVLGEDLHAEMPLPPFDYSAMDGYAFCSNDLGASPPFQLPVLGESRAGSEPLALPTGAAFRIFTGAPIPTGADTVLIQENADSAGAELTFSVRPRRGENIRRQGEDLSLGAVGLRRGTRLGPFQLGLAAALDRNEIGVVKRPKVLILPTGDELRQPGSALRPAAIPESNGFALRALAALAGAEAELLPRLADDRAVAARSLRELFDACEVLVTVGGVSVGAHDVVRAALADAGAELEFWKVAIKPGKPFVFGHRGRTLILGLPGNPVSAQVTFALFGVPLLRALSADSACLPPTRSVRLAQPLSQKPGRLGLYRARLEGDLARLDANQASGSTLSLAEAEVLVLAPAEIGSFPAGSALDAIHLRDL